jgi:hypothetical protein
MEFPLSQGDRVSGDVKVQISWRGCLLTLSQAAVECLLDRVGHRIPFRGGPLLTAASSAKHHHIGYSVVQYPY